MPPRKPLPPLPPTEDLQRIIRELGHTGQTLKAELLRLLMTDPATPTIRLAERLGRSGRMIGNYLRVLREEGLEKFLEPPDRKRRISDSDLEKLRAMIRNNEIGSIREAVEWARERLGADYTISGMRDLLGREFPVGRRLKEKGEGPHSRRTTNALEVMEGRLVEFLNLLPTSRVATEWGRGLQSALRLLLPQAERIAVSLNTSSRLDERGP